MYWITTQNIFGQEGMIQPNPNGTVKGIKTLSKNKLELDLIRMQECLYNMAKRAIKIENF